MIEFETGNILASESEALVNTVNCVGVMGRGIALQFKQAFPDNFRAYAIACKRGEVRPGHMFVQPLAGLGPTRLIVNFPTKRHWRGASRIEDIESGLQDLVRLIREESIKSIAIPPLGAGLGGLEWALVKPRIEAALAPLDDVHVVVFEPNYTVTSMPAVTKNRTVRMTPGRASLVTLMDSYLRGLGEPDITLLEIHKLMFFLQESGEELRLNYAKAPHGPYAENLRHVLNDTEGTLTTGYLDGGDSPTKRIAIVPGALDDALAFVERSPSTMEHLASVRKLVRGFETPFGLELLTTVYWLLKRDPQLDDSQVLSAVHKWDVSKSAFQLEHVTSATNRLRSTGWVIPSPSRA